MPDASLRARVTALVPPSVLDALRPAARRVGLAAPVSEWWQAAGPVWNPPSSREQRDRWCNVCRWTGSAFLGEAHTESANCPQCGSIARDRFLLWCFTKRSPKMRDARVIETSPRLGDDVVDVEHHLAKRGDLGGQRRQLVTTHAADESLERCHVADSTGSTLLGSLQSCPTPRSVLA